MLVIRKFNKKRKLKILLQISLLHFSLNVKKICKMYQTCTITFQRIKLLIMNKKTIVIHILMKTFIHCISWLQTSTNVFSMRNIIKNQTWKFYYKSRFSEKADIQWEGWYSVRRQIFNEKDEGRMIFCQKADIPWEGWYSMKRMREGWYSVRRMREGWYSVRRMRDDILWKSWYSMKRMRRMIFCKKADIL